MRGNPTVVGGATAGLAKGGSAVIKKIAPKVVPKFSDTLRKMFGSAEKEVCAGGACPCFVAGTPVETAAGAQPIERVKLGTRVGPDASACEAVDVSQWFALELELIGPRGPGDVFHIALLRPAEWIQEVSATQGSAVHVALDELNVQGWAFVREISRPHLDGQTSGCPVTGTIEHTGYDVMSVKLAGWSAPLEVTMAHRLFSESRNDWVAASKLEIGETLRTENGTVVVDGLEKTARAPVPVYNLEVLVGHQYYIGEGRVLAHNTYGGGANPGSARTFTSSDPLVADLANDIEKAYPGHVVGVNVPVRDATGNLLTDADILLKNSAIQVKAGSGTGLTRQVLATQNATGLPTIGYGPNLGGSVVKGIQKAGGLATRDRQLLIDVVAP